MIWMICLMLVGSVIVLSVCGDNIVDFDKCYLVELCVVQVQIVLYLNEMLELCGLIQKYVVEYQVFVDLV